MEELCIGDRYNFKRVLKLKKLKTALKDQFAKMEESVQDVLSDDTVFDEFNKLEHFVWATEKAADNALLKSEKFLEENSVEALGTDTPRAGTTSSASRTNGSTAAKPGRDSASTAARPGSSPAETQQVPLHDPARTGK